MILQIPADVPLARMMVTGQARGIAFIHRTN